MEFSIIDNEDYHNSFRIYHDRTKQLLTDKLEIHFIELPKFNQKSPNIHDSLDRWLLFLDEKNPIKSLEEVIKVDSLIKEAEKRLEILKQDPKAREQYEMVEKYIHDYYSGVGGARRKGRDEGLKEGLKEGLEKGEEKGKKQALKQVTLSLLAKEMSYEDIQDATGLAFDEIKELAKDQSERK